MRKEIVALEYDTGFSPQCLEAASSGSKNIASEFDRAAVCNLEPVDAPQKRALSRSASSDDRDDLSRLDLKRDAVQDYVSSEPLTDVF
jgi:hypothetical protein